jgi:Xaa-Pro aminopeptidase
MLAAMTEPAPTPESEPAPEPEPTAEPAPSASQPHTAPPFDVDLLDAMMEEAQLDVLLISSPHALRHALDGYRFFLYDKLDSVGVSRYAPLLGYVRGRVDQAFYVAWGDEGWGISTASLWVPQCETVAWTAAQAAARAAELIAQRAGVTARVGVETPYLTADAYAELRQSLSQARIEDAVLVLDELRTIKRPAELDAMRAGADAVVDAMLAVFADLQAGQSKADVAERLRQEETRRGLEFDYCLIAAAPDLNRAPSSQRISPGAAVSLDSGAGYRGFVADLARMGVIGAPSTLQQELLGMVDEVQQAARAQVRAGRLGGELYDAAGERIQAMPRPQAFSFVAHGMGRRSHEAPRLNVGRPPYPATHRERALQPGMVISIETHVTHPEAGFVKLEDAVAVTADGCEPLGDAGRGWNRAGG